MKHKFFIYKANELTRQEKNWLTLDMIVYLKLEIRLEKEKKDYIIKFYTTITLIV